MTILGPDGTPILRAVTEPNTDPEAISEALLSIDPANHQSDFWFPLLDTPDKLCGAAILAGVQREQFQLLAKAGAQSSDVLQVLGHMATDIAALHIHQHQEQGIDPHQVIDVGVSAEDAGFDPDDILSHEDPDGDQ